MKIFSFVKFFVVLFLINSCVMLNPSSGPGGFYTETIEITYYDPYVKPSQKATLCAKNIFGLFSTGDMGFDALKTKSNIRKIATIEKAYSSRFFIYGKSCMIIKGE